MLEQDNPTAVLVHGCHLQADLNGQTWEQIVFGEDPEHPDQRGRVIAGLSLALKKRAKAIIFSTGASSRCGVLEAQYTYDRLLEHLDSPEPWGRMPGDGPYLKHWLKDHVVLDTESQNTAEEVRRNLAWCFENAIREVYLVSSPWHIQRCLTGALAAANERNYALDIFAHAAEGPTHGVLILEPPHRGDRPETSWHLIARRFFRVPEDRRLEFEERQSALLDEFGA